MPNLKALKAFKDPTSGKQRVKYELFSVDDDEEAQALIDMGFAKLAAEGEIAGGGDPADDD